MDEVVAMLFVVDDVVVGDDSCRQQLSPNV